MDPVDLLVRLVHAGARRDTASALAAALGGEELLALVLDREVDALVPAPGFAQTLDGGDSWREFVRRCRTPGRAAAEVELPRGRRRHAQALAGEGLALVLLGGSPEVADLGPLERYLPLLSFAFAAEQRALLAAADAAQARKAAARAHALAQALDAARADASRLNAELRAEHEHKDRFLAMLAHELRNPLSPLVTSLDLMRLAAPTDAALRERIAVMTRHVRQLSQLVDDLLDVSRVSHGHIELRREPLALGPVVRDALEATQAIVESRRHTVEVSLPQEALYVHGDRVRLTQVLSNLVHNAAKYTDPGGRIAIRVGADAARARVEVCDSGIGIDAENLPHVFAVFNQGPVALARSRGGLGVGLTLARSLARLHGGEVQAQSEGAGKGSTFTLTLPLLRDLPQRSKPPPAAAPAAARALRVLIVDDNEDAADSLGALVKMLGHHVCIAYSGASAIQTAADASVELVFLDIGLPEMDGYEVARRLRRLLGPRPYIIALTGYGGAQHAERTREAGFDEHLLKPAAVEALRAIASRAAARMA